MEYYESANKNAILFIWAEYGFGKCDKFYMKKIKIYYNNLELIKKE